MNDKKSTSRILLLLILAGLLLILIWVGLKTWRIAQAGQSLLGRQSEFEGLLEGSLTDIDPDQAEILVLDTRRDILTIKEETAVFMPLTPYLGWLPEVGPLMVVAPQLLEMADAGTAAAAYALRGLKPALVLIQSDAVGTDQIAKLVQIIDDAEPDLIQTNIELERFNAARADLGDTAVLPWRVQELLSMVDKYMPLAQDGLKAAQVLPEMMGLTGPRRYLILAQNDEEIRPTGGFISGVGELEVENGRITNLSFQDAYNVDDWENKPYAFPPQPLYDFMLLELFLFRDANFWPDFPTSAETAMDLYSYGLDVPPLDGAIAIDQRFLQLLVDAIGQVHIADDDLTINSQNVIEAMRSSWNYGEDETFKEWYPDRKQFIGVFAAAIMNQLFTDFTSIDPVRLGHNMNEALDTKHLQIYMRDPVVATVLEELDWDGRVRDETGQDLLLVVDTNVGYSKANSLVDNSLTYRVDLNNHQADLSLHYQHNGRPREEACLQGDLDYRANITYQTLIDQCLWNYLRIYAPAGSTLISGTAHTVPGTSLMRGEDWNQPVGTIVDPTGLTVFTNFFMLPWGQSLDSHYSYQLPTDVFQESDDVQQYQLTVYKQAGTRPQPLNIMVKLPEGAELLETTPAYTSFDGTIVSFDTNLETDTDFIVTYQ